MAHPYHHALSSARKFGGKPEDYQAIHDWFDATKAVIGDFRHRALRHHSFGIFECEKAFGTVITNSDGKKVPVRIIGEQHVKEDCHGKIPTPLEWFEAIAARKFEPWMGPDRATSKHMEELVEQQTKQTKEVMTYFTSPHQVSPDYLLYTPPDPATNIKITF